MTSLRQKHPFIVAALALSASGPLSAAETIQQPALPLNEVFATPPSPLIDGDAARGGGLFGNPGWDAFFKAGYAHHQGVAPEAPLTPLQKKYHEEWLKKDPWYRELWQPYMRMVNLSFMGYHLMHMMLDEEALADKDKARGEKYRVHADFDRKSLNIEIPVLRPYEDTYKPDDGPHYSILTEESEEGSWLLLRARSAAPQTIRPAVDVQMKVDVSPSEPFVMEVRRGSEVSFSAVETPSGSVLQVEVREGSAMFAPGNGIGRLPVRIILPGFGVIADPGALDVTVSGSQGVATSLGGAFRVTPYAVPFDPLRASELLSEAGWTDVPANGAALLTPTRLHAFSSANALVGSTRFDYTIAGNALRNIAPQYRPDAPVERALFGSSAYATFNAGAKPPFAGPNPFGAALIVNAVQNNGAGATDPGNTGTGTGTGTGTEVGGTGTGTGTGGTGTGPTVPRNSNALVFGPVTSVDLDASHFALFTGNFGNVSGTFDAATNRADLRTTNCSQSCQFEITGTIAEGATHNPSVARIVHVSGMLNGAPFGSVGGVNSGMHVVFGTRTPIAQVPTTGTFTYNFVAATSPAYSNGSTVPGSLTGAAVVDFASLRVGVGMTATMPDQVYSIQTPGATADPSASTVRIVAGQPRFSGNGNFTRGTTVCAGGCRTAIAGQFLGANAAFASIVFDASISGFRTGAGPAVSLNGAALGRR